jgi:tetratricopeptide (TPR) repeat protein
MAIRLQPTAELYNNRGVVHQVFAASSSVPITELSRRFGHGNFPPSLFLLTFKLIGDNINAMRDFQAAMVLDSRHPFAYYNAGNILLFHRQYHQALQNYDVIIEKCKYFDDAVYQNRGIAKTFIGKQVDALKDFDRALQYSQFSAHIYLNRGLLLYKLGQYSSAEAEFTKGLCFVRVDSSLAQSP